jgi:dihydrofolate reductase
MRKIRVMEHISLDGFIQPGGPNADSEYGHGGWTAPYRTPEGAALSAAAQGSGYDLLLGRRTYDLWSGFWPKQKGGPFADNLNAATKYVATHRPEGLEWGPVGQLSAYAIKGVRGLKSEDGPDLLVCGSASLATVLFAQALVDEVVLAIYPLLLGSGKRCFPDSTDVRQLKLVSSKSTPTGVLLNVYRCSK